MQTFEILLFDETIEMLKKFRKIMNQLDDINDKENLLVEFVERHHETIFEFFDMFSKCVVSDEYYQAYQKCNNQLREDQQLR